MNSPLTPADCDLQDFPRMMIDIPRLFASEFDATATDAEWRCGVTLWLKSFHQVPAASLPDDDVQLTRLCGLGRDVRSWRKNRDGALRGWVKCEDGRLYHPVVAEIALEAWLEKLTQRLSSGAGNAARWGAEFEPEPIRAEIGRAATLLAALNPKSKALSKQQASQALRRSQRDTPTAVPTGRTEVPSGSQGKGREEKGKNPPVSPPAGQVLPFDPEVGGEAASPKRGSRLPADWRPGADLIAFAIREGFTEREADHIAAKFRDFWTAKAGKDGVKLDWPATWRNWVRNEAERRGVHGASPRPRRQSFV